MKTKKLGKKLVLNKETISNLKIDELKKLAGGDIPITTTRRLSCIIVCTDGGGSDCASGIACC
jgi:hypothetical protein